MSLTSEVRRQLGYKRAEVSYIILNELKKKNWTLSRVAKSIGCSAEAVSRTVRGHGHSQQVLDALKRIGIPETLLYDPRDTNYQEISHDQHA